MITLDRLLKDRDELDRTICEKSLHEFMKHFWTDMEPETFTDGWHIRLMCEHLEAVANGEIQKLIINIPPRSCKSLTVAVAFPSWLWAKRPDPRFPLHGPQTRVMSLSYSGSFAMRDSRKMLNLIKSPRYQDYWSHRVSIASDQKAKTRFENTRMGFRLPSSVRGMATGEGGDIVLVDDPISAADAKSDIERETVINWWRETMQSRLNNAQFGAFIVIMQRLHENDLTGHILANETGWTHLCLPGRYEVDHPFVCAADRRTKDGDLLWPEHMPEHRLKSLEIGMGSYGRAGQIQQRPAPREGGMFEKRWFKIVNAAPAGGNTVRAWDLASSDEARSSWTAGILMKRVRDEFYVMDVVREQGSPKAVEDTMVNTASQDGKNVTVDFPQDPGQAGKAQKLYLTQKLAGHNVRSSPETGSKITRAEPYSAQAEAGNVYLMKGDWNAKYLDELIVFPNSEQSDQVDASSRGFARLIRKARSVGGAGWAVG